MLKLPHPADEFSTSVLNFLPLLHFCLHAVQLIDAVNLHVLNDIDNVDDYLPVSSSPHRDTLYLDEDDGGDVDLTLSPCKRPALPPHLPAKLGRPWLRYVASLALLVALVCLSVWVLLPVFQRPLVLAIPVHRPFNNNNLLEAYNPLHLMLFSEIKRDLQPERDHHSLAPTPNPLVDDRSELLRYFPQLPLLLAKGTTSACIFTPYQFEHANDGKSPTSAPILRPPTEHHGRPRTPATLVTSHWHNWLPSSAITTLELEVVTIHQAVNRMGSQLKLYSYLQAEEVRRWDLAEEQENQKRQQDQPEPVGVRFPAYLEMACEASSNEFMAWYGPVWLSLSTHNRQLIRERDVNIDILEYLLHEREWQFYRNKTRGNWKKTRSRHRHLERRAPHE
ncbi:hypothetical protein CGCSCA5_v011219 [Colletotrichum siamense]|nr:hypothetical protein CGCSCA5_v011219 [Colletotrichum siamense]